MIDQALIDDNSAHLTECLKNKTHTPLNGLYQLSNILDQNILEKLSVYLQTVGKEQWSAIPQQQNKPRSVITWDADTVIEELSEVFNSVTPTINAVFSDVYKHFWGVTIWRDTEGYNIDWHTDNPDIDVALQMYLYTEPGLGTVFGSESNQTLISSIHNTGYLAVHTGDNKIPHRTENTIPAGVTRYNLYAIWSRFPKHTADAQ